MTGKMASGSVFGRARSGSKAIDLTDADTEADVREDEEQNVKLTQTIDLLLAAGYFRARIKGLEPFDKCNGVFSIESIKYLLMHWRRMTTGYLQVVGGMTWCITTCNFDIDIDLLFQENSTIGQKIALTEKIVAVLPRMKCPHRIEPHQIQGLDFIHIYPVVQWLVKRAIATREEMGDYIRQYSISQFHKHYNMPQDEEFQAVKEKAVETLSDVKSVYRPQRKYKRHDADKLTDEEARVHSTLLEYGRKFGLSKSTKSSSEASGDLASKKSAVEAGLSPGATEEEEEEAHRQEEERRIKALMSGMSATGAHEGKLTASAVGSIVGMQSREIQEMASEYAGKQAELEQAERAPRMSGVQQHKRVITALQKKVENQKESLKQIKTEHDDLQSSYVEVQQKLAKVQEYCSKLDHEMSLLEEQETGTNQSILQELRSLVAMNESLKKQEQDFRAHCKEEMARLQAEIAKVKDTGGSGDSEQEERMKLIDKQYQSDKEKLHKIRLLLARKNREISSYQRKIDEVPSRAELSQYQRRFIELYNQIAGKHKETKQFYTLYNTLDDTKLYLNKEVTLLNSIHDNFQQAMSSQAGRDQYLKQLDQIVEGVKQNRVKLDKRAQEEKMRRDQLNDQYLTLVDKQRLYFKTVKEFMEECRKNEILQSKLRE